jgi:hypothetical protein
MELARKGDLEELSKHLSPGAARIGHGLLMLIMMRKAGLKADALDRFFEELSFELEDLGDGLVRVHMGGPDRKPPEEIYLVPHEGSWQLATESDLPGPAADLLHALNRLQLLALCQHTYWADQLGGEGVEYAATLRELAEGLNRSPVYADVIEPDFITAVEVGLPSGGYTFGPIESDGKEFAYYATPDAYGTESRETLLIDNEGRVWAKDLGGEPPPSTWPGPNPEKQGWKRRRDPWR